MSKQISATGHSMIVEAPETNGPGHIFTKYIGDLETAPQEERYFSLGNFTSDQPAKGFSIVITPESELDSVVTKITTLGSEKNYELVLHIANYGAQPVSTEVWRI